jgi:PAS domain-containing protein
LSKNAQNSQYLSDPEWGSSEAKRFGRLALRYQEIANAVGIKLHPFRSPEMPLFLKATPEERKTATDFLETIVSIHEETISESEAPINTQQLLWRALRRFSLIPGPDIFSQITNEDVTLIYDESQRAIFWNLQFFKFSSLSVEELFFGHWYKFTKRSPEIQQKLYEMAVNVISGKITGSFIPGVPPHVVEEIDTLECIKTIMEIPYGSVLTNNGKFGGILIVQKMRIIE